MNKKISIKQIPQNIDFTGYVWMSDSQNPVVDPTEIKKILNKTSDNSNPFVIEGQLYCDSTKQSFSIRYTDGEYFVVEYNLSEANKTNGIYKEFVSNRIPNNKKLRFFAYWEAKPDSLCKDMQVLQPADFAFVGFGENNDDKTKKERRII